MRTNIQLPSTLALISLVSLISLTSCDSTPPTCGSDDDIAVEVGVETKSLATAPNTGELKVEGWASSELRLAQLMIGSVRATGIGDNFTTWSATLSQAELQLYGDGQLASVPVVAIDACGDAHEFDPLLVYVDAPTGSSAPGLEISVTAADGDCYLPADGSAFARVDVSADVSAVGVLVNLSAAIAGDFLATQTNLTRLSLDGEAARSSALFRPKAAGQLGLLASAGSNYAIDDSGLIAVGAPSFSGAKGTIPRELELLIRASTGGRLARCWAEAAVPGVVQVDGGGSPNLLTTTAIFDSPSCSQEALFLVEFSAEAPAGAQLSIMCEDSHGQRGVVELQVEPTP
jgi:hypothetical protein